MAQKNRPGMTAADFADGDLDAWRAHLPEVPGGRSSLLPFGDLENRTDLIEIR